MENHLFRIQLGTHCNLNAFNEAMVKLMVRDGVAIIISKATPKGPRERRMEDYLRRTTRAQGRGGRGRLMSSSDTKMPSAPDANTQTKSNTSASTISKDTRGSSQSTLRRTTSP